MAAQSGYGIADSGFLLSGAGEASAWGSTQWAPMNGAWRAEWPVSAKGWPDGALHLMMMVRPRRPSEPTVVYMVRGAHMRRVDCNGGHQGQRFTHIQGADSFGDPERTCPVPDDFVAIAHGPDAVPGDIYRRVLQDSAKLFRIDVSAVDWEDPPEGSAP